MIKQEIFTYQFEIDSTESNFYVNQTNYYAFNGLVNNNSTFSFLYGPNKSGKSYLSKIWQKINKSFEVRQDNIDFTINTNSNILIDDFLLYDQEKIFYIINNCILNNFKVLITCNYKINEIDFKFNDLSSRIKTFSNFEINPPNDEMLLTILTKLLTEKQFIINTNDIFNFILRRVDRTYQGIYDIVNKLDILSLEKKRQLTIPLIKEIL